MGLGSCGHHGDVKMPLVLSGRSLKEEGSNNLGYWAEVRSQSQPARHSGKKVWHFSVSWNGSDAVAVGSLSKWAELKEHSWHD